MASTYKVLLNTAVSLCGSWLLASGAAQAAPAINILSAVQDSPGSGDLLLPSATHVFEGDVIVSYEVNDPSGLDYVAIEVWDAGGASPRLSWEETDLTGQTSFTGTHTTTVSAATVHGDAEISVVAIAGDQSVSRQCAAFTVIPKPWDLALSTNDDCLRPGFAGNDTLTVRLMGTHGDEPITGGDFSMVYDQSKLAFLAAAPGGSPYTMELDETVNSGAGTIHYRLGVEDGAVLSDGPLVMLTFTAIGEDCASTSLVSLASSTHMVAADNADVAVRVSHLPPITLDGTPPTLALPGNLALHSDAGFCHALRDLSATDNCDPAVTLTFTRSDGKTSLADAFSPADSPITVSRTTTDRCGNSVSHTQTISVDSLNELLVDVELSPPMIDHDTAATGTTTSRCLTFQIWSCPGTTPRHTIEQVAFFPVDAAPHRANAISVLVPCGSYNCITLRDRHHTLRSTAPSLLAVGTTYAAAFVGIPSTGGHWLYNGNLNQDRFIDILDYGTCQSRIGLVYPSPNTTCTTAFPHVDVNGDGRVTVADVAAIQANFFKRSENNCCGQSGLNPPRDGGGEEGPVAAISVEELRLRGLEDLIVADVNNDGMVDETDLAIAAQNGQE